MDDSLFAILALLPKPVGSVMSNEATTQDGTTQDGDGVILLFRAGDHVPIAIWFVKKVLTPVLNFEFFFLSEVFSWELDVSCNGGIKSPCTRLEVVDLDLLESVEKIITFSLTYVFCIFIPLSFLHPMYRCSVTFILLTACCLSNLIYILERYHI